MVIKASWDLTDTDGIQEVSLWLQQVWAAVLSSAPSRWREDVVITGWEGLCEQASPAARLIYTVSRGGGVSMNHSRYWEDTAEDVSLNLNAAVNQMSYIPSQVWLIPQHIHNRRHMSNVQMKQVGRDVDGHIYRNRTHEHRSKDIRSPPLTTHEQRVPANDHTETSLSGDAALFFLHLKCT